MSTAFDSFDLAGAKLANRIAMAPMTRSRAYGPGATPTPEMAVYYGQRASAGLIVTEGIQPSVVGQGYPDTPGLHSQAQVAAWRPVTQAVHDRGGVIFAQLMHTGRVGHPSLLPDGLVPVGASAVAAAGQVFTSEGPKDFVVPRELSEEEIAETIADFVAAARNAIAAGFDGVEIHGANGYLIHQFLSVNANQRTDGWGGSIEGRIRLAVEIATAVADAIGGERLGFRISPGNPYNDISEENVAEVYETLVARLAPLGLAYLHLLEGSDRGLTRRLRQAWPSAFVLNPFTHPEVTGHDALVLVEEELADLIAFGALFLANPDLPRRLAEGGPFNNPDAATFYGGDERGYTDYPALD
jgi:N-ethylmaleimide reductase